MKNFILFIALILGISVVGCTKKDSSCTPPGSSAPESEVDILTKYITENNISASKDGRGFYYKVDALGTGTHPDACSDVTVNYKGWLTDGSVFDQAENVKFNLGGLISGWQAGIPLIAKGGKITLYLPPSLGYGSKATGKIPANSILIFSIDLVKVH
jgi:FKBP-type peptidyl-prolyl cis-trans isomerase FkpA